MGVLSDVAGLEAAAAGKLRVRQLQGFELLEGSWEQMAAAAKVRAQRTRGVHHSSQLLSCGLVQCQLFGRAPGC